MAAKLIEAIRYFIAECPYVVSLQDFLTKTRIELWGGYVTDFYYNETLGKYGYTLIRQNRRIIGWDNAPHHPNLSDFPHHFHNEDGSVCSSGFTGNPVQDIGKVVATINAFIFKELSRLNQD